MLNAGGTEIGPMGVATELLGPFEQKAQISLWFVVSPLSHPWWTNYLISIVHLRLLDEQDDPYLEFPEAGYELVVLALDPEKRPKPRDVDTWRFLQPLNVREQFTAADDEEAREIGKELARYAVRGLLLLEPSGIQGAREMWHDAVQEAKRKV